MIHRDTPRYTDRREEEEEEIEERTGIGGGMNLNPSTSIVGDDVGVDGDEVDGEPGTLSSFLDDPFVTVNATAQ